MYDAVTPLRTSLATLAQTHRRYRSVTDTARLSYTVAYCFVTPCSFRLWDGSSGELLATLQHDGWVYQASWNADGTRILSASNDGTARIHIFGDKLLAYVCESVGRNFSLEEWRSYLGSLPYHRTCDTAALHPSYLSDVAARLQDATLSEAEAIAEVSLAPSVDSGATPVNDAEAREIVTRLRSEAQE